MDITSSLVNVLDQQSDEHQYLYNQTLVNIATVTTSNIATVRLNLNEFAAHSKNGNCFTPREMNSFFDDSVLPYLNYQSLVALHKDPTSKSTGNQTGNSTGNHGNSTNAALYSMNNGHGEISPSHSAFESGSEKLSPKSTSPVSDNGTTPDTSAINSGADDNFICQLCNKSFKKFRFLEYHLLHHTDYKSKVCGECEERFSTPSELSKHKEELHNAPCKRFTCEMCNKTFGREDNYKRHLLSHSDTRFYTCGLCKAEFKRLDVAKVHCSRKHKNITCVIVMSKENKKTRSPKKVKQNNA